MLKSKVSKKTVVFANSKTDVEIETNLKAGPKYFKGSKSPKGKKPRLIKKRVEKPLKVQDVVSSDSESFEALNPSIFN